MKTKFTTDDQLKIEGKTYDVVAFAKDEDGTPLVLLDGWGERIARYDAEIQEGFRTGEIEVV